MYSYMGQNDKAVVKVKVTTNASRWHATATAMMGDDADFVITKARGKSGEEMEFYLQPSMSEMLAKVVKSSSTAFASRMKPSIAPRMIGMNIL